MKIAFELNHPAQAHLFKYPIRQLIHNNHHVTVFIKHNPVIQKILEETGIPFISLGKKGKSLLHKAWKQIVFVFMLLEYYKKHHYQLGVGVSVSFPVLSKITKIQTIVLDDDDKKATALFASVAHTFATVLLRPEALMHEGITNKTIYYRGYHELAYLHPGFFKPDAGVLKDQGIDQNEIFFVVRLVALKAHHDAGIKGISKDQAHIIVKYLKKYGRVIITQESENDLPQGSEPLKISPAKIHHLMAFAKLIVSDGQTMCSEAACLGTPSIRINDFVGRISYLEEQESKWHLTYGFKPDDFDSAFKMIETIIKEDSAIYKVRSEHMINNSINFAGFLTWFIENYPTSARIMKENPDYQYNFI